MIKFTLYVGLNDKDSKKQEVSTLEAYKIVNKLLLNYTEGATIFEATGIYKHENGTFTTEKTLRIELLFIDRAVVLEIVEQLKKILNQESIAMSTENIESELL